MSARAAGRRAGRRGGGATVNDDEFVYGRNPVRELVLAGRREASELFATEQALAGADWLSARRVIVRTRDQLARLVGTGDHQGVVARVEPYPYVDLRELLGADGPLICLDGAHDPRNLGAIARVAEGAGAAGMIISPPGGARGGAGVGQDPRRPGVELPAPRVGGERGVTGVVAKAWAGAVEHLPSARVGSILAAVRDARGAGRPAFGAHPDGAEDYRTAHWIPQSLIVMGAEGEGLRPRVREACDLLVRIPMRGRVASLNISVACGLLLYEAIRNTQ